MALYIAKLKPGSDIDYISDHFEENTELWVKEKLIHLNMFVFESSPELAKSVLLSDSVVYVKSATDIGIIESTISEDDETISRISENKCEGIQSSTHVGDFSGETEYYSHLELICSRDFSQRTHEYHPVYTGKGVDCYIIDTGVKTDHPLLKNTETIESFNSGFTVKGQPDSNYDDNGHGTEIALFVTGQTCGVGRDVNIIPLKVVGRNGNGSNIGIAIAINKVIEHHQSKNGDKPSVINYSLGMMPSPTSPTYYPDKTGDDVVTLDALKTATEHGIHVVAAAGNGFGSGPTFIGPMMSKFTNGALNLSPSDSGNNDPGQGNPIIVGSTNADSSLSDYDSDPTHMAWFSNYGVGNTINAPGSDMVIPKWDWQPETQEIYRWRDGTSFSCPVVVGLVCLYLEENPTASVIEVKNWLIENATINKIKNLMESYELKTSEVVFELGNQYVTFKLEEDLPEKYLSYSKIQISGLDGNDLLGFDGWYDISSIASREIVIDFDSPAQMSLVVEKTGIVLGFLDNTHELTDGIMKWQNDSSSNKLVRHESKTADAYFKIFTVDQTFNGMVYNPLQHSNLSFASEYGQKHSVQEGVQPNVQTPRYIISDRDIGTHAKFSFLYESGETEVLNLEMTDKLGDEYYYEILTPKPVVSFYRGVNEERVKNSIILDVDVSFTDELKERASSEQNELIDFFENFKKKQHISKFNHDSVNESDASETNESDEYDVIELFNSDFRKGTLRITKPGYYFLREDIFFHPNADNDFFPTYDQVASGLYPMGRGGAYHLGFFAAITIECENVVFDLNGYTIQQTKLHNLQQRFFANIELANAPFIPSQGPHSFGDSFRPAKNVLIMNGNLGVSSHHGVHANLADNVILHNLEINNFEVAGVALNGTKTAILSELNVRGTDLKTKVMSTFSHAVFIKRHLDQILRTSYSSTKLNMPSCGHTKANTPSDSKTSTNILEVGSGPTELTLKLPSGELGIEQIIKDLEEDLNHVTESILEDTPITNYFKNESGFYDGNMYGVVLHVAGVVVHDFLQERTDESVGNENILINELTIRNIVSKPEEVLGIETSDGKMQTGPFGDVFHPGIASADQNGKCVYEGNSLSNAQLFLEKYEQYSDTEDLSKIESSVITWAETPNSDLFEILDDTNTKLVPNKDSMAHTMKGNIGLFISGAKNLNVHKLEVDGVVSKGDVLQPNFLKDDNKIRGNRIPSGGNSFGMLITASSDLNFFNNKIYNVTSDNTDSEVCDVRILSGENINGTTETCVMEINENSIKMNDETTCLSGTTLNVTYDYSSDDAIRQAFFLVKSKSGTKKFKAGVAQGTGTKTKEFTYKGDTPTKITAVLSSDYTWKNRVAVDKIVPSDCSVVKVETATNFIDEEIAVDVAYNLPEQMDVVVQIYSDSGFIRSTRIKNLDGKGHFQKNIKLKGNQVATKAIAFASKSSWKLRYGQHKKMLEKSVPVTGLVDQICLGDNELTTSFRYNLHDTRDMVFQLYSDDGIIRSVREKNMSGNGDLHKKIRLKGDKRPTRLVAFVSKGKWKDRIGHHVVKDIKDCDTSPSVSVSEETLCFYDNEISGKILYENLSEEMDVVMNVYSASGFEQSLRVKKLEGSGETSAKLKLKKNFSPSRLVVFLTKSNWKERVDFHKIDVVGECGIEEKEDVKTGNMFIPVCTEDARVCDNGDVVVRDVKNNCQFPPCEGGDALVCPADVIECKNGKFVGRNPFDDCNFYDCGDYNILPIEDDDSEERGSGEDSASDDPIFCTKDLKYCKGGGVVSRNPKNGCEFEKCPEDYIPDDEDDPKQPDEESDEDESPIMCSQEMKRCPNGLLVGRNIHDGCRFYECPEGDNEPPVEDEDDTPAYCARDVRVCPDGTVVARDPHNHCRFEPCPVTIMRGIHLVGVSVTNEEPNITIEVELLEGISSWQYEINGEDGTLVSDYTTSVSFNLSSGKYTIRVYGVDEDGHQLGRIFSEKIIVDVGNITIPVVPSSGEDESPTPTPVIQPQPIPRKSTVAGQVSDWNQPVYYEDAGIIPSSDGFDSGKDRYTGLTRRDFLAWCAPTSAAIQLEHLIQHGGLTSPAFADDGFDSSSDINPNLKTIPWNSANGWGNYLVDGPSHRGKVGDPTSISACSASDFGWCMDTNGKGQYNFNSSNPTTGTTIEMIWKGLNEFYSLLGWHDLIGMVSHSPVGRYEGNFPSIYKSSVGSAGDPGAVFKTIMNEIDQNRTIIASFYGWSIGNPVTQDESTDNGQPIHYYEMSTSESNEALGEIYTPPVEESDSVGDGLGHTVVIYGYIQAGSPEDISNGTVDWILVRDNDHTTQRNIALPFQGTGATGKLAFDSLIATFYTDIAKGTYKDPCVVSIPPSPTESSKNTETPPPVDLDFDEELFMQNKKTWVGSDIKNYQFTVTRTYYGPEDSRRPVRVTVENGEIVDANFADELANSAKPDKSQYMTLTEMFDYAWKHYKNNVVQLDVEYSKTHGYISSSYVDVDRRIADEEMGIEITDFEVMDISIPEPPIRSAPEFEVTVSDFVAEPDIQWAMVELGNTYKANVTIKVLNRNGYRFTDPYFMGHDTIERERGMSGNVGAPGMNATPKDQPLSSDRGWSGSWFPTQKWDATSPFINNPFSDYGYDKLIEWEESVSEYTFEIRGLTAGQTNYGCIFLANIVDGGSGFGGSSLPLTSGTSPSFSEIDQFHWCTEVFSFDVPAIPTPVPTPTPVDDIIVVPPVEDQPTPPVEDQPDVVVEDETEYEA